MSVLISRKMCRVFIVFVHFSHIPRMFDLRRINFVSLAFKAETGVIETDAGGKGSRRFNSARVANLSLAGPPLFLFLNLTFLIIVLI